MVQAVEIQPVPEKTRPTSITDLAARLGMGEMALRNLRDRGCPVKNRKGQWDEDVARAWLDENVPARRHSRRTAVNAARAAAAAADAPGGNQDAPAADGAAGADAEGDPLALVVEVDRARVPLSERALRARVHRDEADAELRRLKLAVQRGELVRLEDVKAHDIERVGYFRACLLGDVPRRAAQAATGLSTREIEKVFRGILRELCEQMARPTEKRKRAARRRRQST